MTIAKLGWSYWRIGKRSAMIGSRIDRAKIGSSARLVIFFSNGCAHERCDRHVSFHLGGDLAMWVYVLDLRQHGLSTATWFVGARLLNYIAGRSSSHRRVECFPEGCFRPRKAASEPPMGIICDTALSGG